MAVTRAWRSVLAGGSPTGPGLRATVRGAASGLASAVADPAFARPGFAAPRVEVQTEAALPGAVAAHTDLPVIGVPLKSSLSVLDGLDALLAIAQMPPGVPVAAVGVDNARNAAALALRILGA